MPRLNSLTSANLVGSRLKFVPPVAEALDPDAVWVTAAKGFPTTSIDVFAVTSGQLASSSSTLYSPLEANSYSYELTISPQNNFVYAPNGTKNRIEIIPVDPNTGIYKGSGATSTSTSALGSFPADISISPDGKYAYVAFNNTFKIGIYSRNATTGALTGISNLRDGYKFTKITSNGAYLYTVQNNLLMYSRNISTGALTLIAENSDAIVNGGFAKIDISNDNRSLYVADFSQNNFYAYLIDPATGLASLSQTISLTSFGADVRSQEVEVSNDGKHVYVTLYDINQVLGTTVVMYSRSLSAPFTLTQANVYTISGAVGEQISNLILTKQQDLLVAAVSGNPGAPIHSWTRNTTTGTLTINTDVVGFGGSIETNKANAVYSIANGDFTDGYGFNATSDYIQINTPSGSLLTYITTNSQIGDVITLSGGSAGTVTVTLTAPFGRYIGNLYNALVQEVFPTNPGTFTEITIFNII
jgi:6-phosphogluconolactonase (cycloisomerase 2 family)